jgi:hypothetical protein
LGRLAERLLSIRPFVPDEELPQEWRALLKKWISGIDVEVIGPDNMRVIEEAFAYRLVWGLEAIRMRRAVLGGSSDLLEGVAAASLQTGLPSISMSMLVRAGLPSRRAAIAAIENGNPQFIDLAGMMTWLQSDKIAALTDEGEWPTPETAELWAQFRNDMLSGQIQKWTIDDWSRDVDARSYRMEPELDQTYRVVASRRRDTVWICTPDFKRVVKVAGSIRMPQPSLLLARFERDSKQVSIHRAGRGNARWL